MLSDSPADRDETDDGSSLLDSLRGRGFVRLLKFGIVGASGVVVNWVIFELFLRVVLPMSLGPTGEGALVQDERILVANAAGVVVSIFTNFVLNDRWTWGDRLKGGVVHWFQRLGKYYALASFAAAVQLFVTWASFKLLWKHVELVVFDYDLTFGYDVRPSLALLTGIAFGMIINFLASHLWAFRDAVIEDVE